MSLRKIISIHACREALRARSAKDLKHIYLRSTWQQNPALVDLASIAKSKKMTIEILSEKKLNQVGELHQGVCVCTTGQAKFDIKSLKPKSLALVLDRIQDTKNLGAIIRTAWLMSVNVIYISSRHSASLSPAVMKAASGGVEYVPIEIRTSMHQVITELKKYEFWIYALDSHSQNTIWKESFEDRVAFVLGGESSGVKKGLKKLCDKQLSIPQRHKSASYNVSVAAGIALGECLRQRL